MKSMKFHKFAEFFPLMEGEEFDGLVQDIRERGLLEPIVLLDEKILDGRNRFKACKAAGVEPRFVEFNGDQGPLHFVASKNFHRRGLQYGQRVVIWQDMYPHLEKEEAELAASRKAETQAKPGEGKVGASPRRQTGGRGRASERIAAAIGGVSRDTVERVNRVRREAPELIPAIRSGKLLPPFLEGGK